MGSEYWKGFTYGGAIGVLIGAVVCYMALSLWFVPFARGMTEDIRRVLRDSKR